MSSSSTRIPEGSEAQGIDRDEYLQGGDYVKKQGWATMPGEAEPASRVADECAKLLMLKLA